MRNKLMLMRVRFVGLSVEILDFQRHNLSNLIFAINNTTTPFNVIY